MTIDEAIKVLRIHNTTGKPVLRITAGKTTEKDLLAQVLDGCESLISERTELSIELKQAKQYLSELMNIVDSFGLDKLYECDRVDYACKNCKYFSEHLNHDRCEVEGCFVWKHKQDAIDLINKE